MRLPFASILITLSLVLGHKTKDLILEPLYFLDQGHTIIDYNSNITTRIISKKNRRGGGEEGGGWYNIIVIETVPIRERLAIIDHYSIHIECSIYYYNIHELYMSYTLPTSSTNQPWINIFWWVSSTRFDICFFFGLLF